LVVYSTDRQRHHAVRIADRDSGAFSTWIKRQDPHELIVNHQITAGFCNDRVMREIFDKIRGVNDAEDPKLDDESIESDEYTLDEDDLGFEIDPRAKAKSKRKLPRIGCWPFLLVVIVLMLYYEFGGMMRGIVPLVDINNYAQELPLPLGSAEPAKWPTKMLIFNRPMGLLTRAEDEQTGYVTYVEQGENGMEATNLRLRQFSFTIRAGKIVWETAQIVPCDQTGVWELPAIGVLGESNELELTLILGLPHNRIREYSSLEGRQQLRQHWLDGEYGQWTAQLFSMFPNLEMTYNSQIPQSKDCYRAKLEFQGGVLTSIKIGKFDQKDLYLY